MARLSDPGRALTDKLRLIMQRKVSERSDLEHRRKLLDQQILALTQDINALRYLEKNFTPEEMEVKEIYVDFLDKGGVAGA